MNWKQNLLMLTIPSKKSTSSNGSSFYRIQSKDSESCRQADTLQESHRIHQNLPQGEQDTKWLQNEIPQQHGLGCQSYSS